VRNKDFLSKNISSFAGTLESVISAEDLCRAQGLLQRLDPRVKLMTTLLFIVIVALAGSLLILAIVFALVMSLSLLSRIPSGFYLKRVLLFVPLTAVIAIPALFITSGQPLISLGSVVVTEQGARTAGLLVLRVTDSISLGMLLILTTRWNSVLAAFRWLRIPALVVDILGMTYRYLFVLLHTVNSMFLARRSRLITAASGAESRRWLGHALATTMHKSQHFSEEVYLAMVSRGYQGEARVLSNMRMKRQDFLWLAFAFAASLILLWVNHRWA
jgi:cobalt ECF transporter T component CbiQ